MWLADRWKDYEVIDCSCGEKLERWSKYILLRPDPQVIWDTPKTNKNWKSLMVTITEARKAVVSGSFLICRRSGP